MTRFGIVMTALLVACPLFAAEEDYLLQGNSYLAEKAYDKAVQAFRRATRLDPKSAAAYRGLGSAYYNLGNGETASFPQLLEEAIAAYRQALSIASDADTLYHLGMSYLMAGNMTEASIVRQRLSLLDRNKANLLAFQIGAEKDAASGASAASYVTIIRTNGSDGEQRTAVKVQNRQVWVPVTFGHKGRSVSTWLLLDTGASSTSVPAALARQLGVTAAETTGGRARLADGSVVQTDDVILDRVRVGPKEKRDLNVKIIPSAGADGIGLLGFDFLGEFLYTVDPKNRVIRWH